MCMKFFLEDLNLDIFSLHLTDTYTCEVVIAPRVRNHHTCYKFFNLENITPMTGRGRKENGVGVDSTKLIGSLATDWFKAKSISLRSFYSSLF